MGIRRKESLFPVPLTCFRRLICRSHCNLSESFIFEKIWQRNVGQGNGEKTMS